MHVAVDLLSPGLPDKPGNSIATKIMRQYAAVLAGVIS